MTTASPDLIKQGEELIKTYGCAGCHEIGGLENEGRIGAELTYEGSKPMEAIDFGHPSRTREDGKWYDHKGYFEHELENPQVFNFGKEMTEPIAGPEDAELPPLHAGEAARRREVDDITGVLTTFLLGSVESLVPKAYRDLSAGDRAAIREGWWLVQKYNCNGCHPVHARKRPVEVADPLATEVVLAEGETWRRGRRRPAKFTSRVPAMRPPTLVGQGARVDPQWLCGVPQEPRALEDEGS
jgi:hypothetical protein